MADGAVTVPSPSPMQDRDGHDHKPYCFGYAANGWQICRGNASLVTAGLLIRRGEWEWRMPLMNTPASKDNKTYMMVVGTWMVLLLGYGVLTLLGVVR
jgi:hypothetical protein